MTLARLALLVAAYLSLDLANPLMPGALTFGAEHSVEARKSERFRAQDAHVAPRPERLAPPPRPLTLRLPAPPAAASSRAPVTRSRLSLPASASPAEDH